jgi:hypothetical protein
MSATPTVTQKGCPYLMPSDSESRSEGWEGFSPRVLSCFSIFTGVFVFALLAVLIYPMFAKPRYLDLPKTTCLSNLKLLSTGAMIYSGDFDDRFPLAAKWMDSIHVYVKDDANFHCDKAPPGEYGYAYNPDAAGSLSTAPDTNTNPLVYDSAAKGRSAVATIASLPNPPRHGDVDNVAYADSHANRVRP